MEGGQGVAVEVERGHLDSLLPGDHYHYQVAENHAAL